MNQIIGLIKNESKRFLKPLFIVTVILLSLSASAIIPFGLLPKNPESTEKGFQKAYVFLFKDKETVPFKQLSGYRIGAYFDSVIDPDDFEEGVTVFPPLIHNFPFPDFSTIEVDPHSPWDRFYDYFTEKGFWLKLINKYGREIDGVEYTDNREVILNIDNRESRFIVDRVLVIYDNKAFYNQILEGTEVFLYESAPYNTFDLFDSVIDRYPGEIPPRIFLVLKDVLFYIQAGWILFLFLSLLLIRITLQPGGEGAGYVKTLPMGDTGICFSKFIFSIAAPLCFALMYTLGVILFYGLCCLVLLGGNIGAAFEMITGIFTLLPWNSVFLMDRILPVNIFIIFLLASGIVFVFSSFFKRQITFALSTLFTGFLIFMAVAAISARIGTRIFMTSLLDHIFIVSTSRWQEVFLEHSDGLLQGLVSFVTAGHPGWWLTALVFTAGCFFLGYGVYKKRELL